MSTPAFDLEKIIARATQARLAEEGIEVPESIRRDKRHITPMSVYFPERYFSEVLMDTDRNAIIEECARVVEETESAFAQSQRIYAAAIRSLKGSKEKA